MGNGGARCMSDLLNGFQITVNGKTVDAGVNEGYVLIALSCKYGMDITGGDDKTGKTMQWCKVALDVGDELEIVAKNDVNRGDIVKEEVRDRTDLLATYFELRDSLKKLNKIV